MRINARITPERVLDAVENDMDTGFCLECGEETSHVEPDAEQCRCEWCGAAAVYGAEQLALMMF